MSNALSGFMMNMTGEESDLIDDTNLDLDPQPGSNNEDENPSDPKKQIDEDIEPNPDIDEDDDPDPDPTTPVKKEKIEKGGESDDKFEFSEEDEKTYASSIYELISEKLGIENEEGDEMPESFDALIEHIEDIITENSTPQYFSDEVRQLDEYVRNGGDIKEFLSSYSSRTYSEKDLESSAGQKGLIRASLKELGFSDDQITAKIDRYEMAEMLEDEAKDALAKLESTAEARTQRELEQREQDYQQKLAQQEQAYTDVITSIKGLSEVNGIKVGKKEKIELTEYIFKKDKDGKTAWQKDNSNIDNMVKLALLSKNQDKFFKSASKKGESEAMRKMRRQMASPGVSKAGKNMEYVADDETGNQGLDALLSRIIG